MTTWGYVRVLTSAPDGDAQRRELTAAGVDVTHLVTERVSGPKARRPALERLLGGLDQGDVLTVVKIDRLGRSDAALIALVDGLRRRGVQVHSLRDRLDTTTFVGRLAFRFMAAFRGRT